MINFYLYYNKNGLDKEEYRPLIEKLTGITVYYAYTIKFEPIKHIIKRIPEHAYYYALDVIKDRWLEAEPYIMTSSDHSYWYAKNIIKGRWPEAEPIIMKDTLYAYWYAKELIKGRFIEAEPYIHRNSILWTEYRKLFNI